MAAGDGLISMTPTSIVHSGTSAVINSDGGVDFTAVTSLSLNGVFTGDYDNYLVVASYKTASGSPSMLLRLRSSGTDATGSNYTRQFLYASSTSVSGARSSTDGLGLGLGYCGTTESGDTLAIYGPALAQPTASRNVNVFGGTVQLNDWASTHSLSTAYDGCTIYGDGNQALTGTVHVFGYEE